MLKNTTQLSIVYYIKDFKELDEIKGLNLNPC